MSKGEGARLGEKIELELQAMRATLDGCAVVSRHERIKHEYEQVGEYVEPLQRRLGMNKVLQMVTDMLDQQGRFQNEHST